VGLSGFKVRVCEHWRLLSVSQHDLDHSNSREIILPFNLGNTQGLTVVWHLEDVLGSRPLEVRQSHAITFEAVQWKLAHSLDCRFPILVVECLCHDVLEECL